jgi:FG-GAP-like repeat
MRLPPAFVDTLQRCTSASFALRQGKRLASIATCFMWFAATPSQAQVAITGIAASPDCDAVTGVSLSGSGSVSITDGNGTPIAWFSSATGVFIPFGQPSNNTVWNVNGGTPATIIPSNFAPQCLPPSLTVSTGIFNARIMQGGLGAPPSGAFSVGNTGGSAVYLPATPYFPGGVPFFSLSVLAPLGPDSSSVLTVSLNSQAFSLPPGRYTASIDFSNAANLSLVTTRQVQLTVVPSVAHDFNRDGFSDVAWRDTTTDATSGALAMWLMNGTRVTNPNAEFVATVPYPLWTVIGNGDFNGDGYADILWRDNSGNLAIWEMKGTQVTNPTTEYVANITGWSVIGVGDFNGDAMSDILWTDGKGNYALWEMNGTQLTNSGSAEFANVTGWTVVGLGDFNGDGKSDILWVDGNGNYALWEMNGTQVINPSAEYVANVTGWTVVRIGDFNGDGMSDILWTDGKGNYALWEMNGTQIINPTAEYVGNATGWSVNGIGDYNGDGRADILWTDGKGNYVLWEMNGTQIVNPSAEYLANVTTNWAVQLPLGE